MSIRRNLVGRWLRCVRLYHWLALLAVMACGLAWLTEATRSNRAIKARVQGRGGFALNTEEAHNSPRSARPGQIRERVTSALTNRLPLGPARNRLAEQFLHRLPVVSLDGTAVNDADLETIGRADTLRRLYLNGSNVEDAALRHLRDLAGLEVLELSETRIGDAGVAHLAGLHQLRTLWLYETRVGDGALEPLRRLRRLEELHLGRTAVGDATLAAVGNLVALRELRLQHTRITDAGLAHLSNLKRLEMLDLSGTAIGDQGIWSVANLPELRLLIVNDTRVTDATIRVLHSLRPGLQVWRSPSPSPAVPPPPIWYPGSRKDECFSPVYWIGGERVQCTTTSETRGWGSP